MAPNLGIISLIATSIFVHMCCKIKKDKLFDQKWENEINEILHDKKYWNIAMSIYKPFFSLFSLIKQIEVNIIKSEFKEDCGQQIFLKFLDSDVLSYKLLLSKEKIHVFYLLILGIFLYSDIELIQGSLFKGDRYNLKMAMTVESS